MNHDHDHDCNCPPDITGEDCPVHCPDCGCSYAVCDCDEYCPDCFAPWSKCDCPDHDHDCPVVGCPVCAAEYNHG